jgi:hypothetical protein
VIGAGLAIIAVALGVAIALLTGNPVLGVAAGGGVLGGGVGSLLVVRTLRTPARVTSGAAVHDSAGGWDEFHRELARARRFERPLGVVRLSVDGSVDVGDLEPLRDEIASLSRRTDRLWTDGENIVMVLPEATPTGIETVLGRIAERVPLAVVNEPGVVLFPDHGLTSGVLISALYSSGKDGAPTPIASVRRDDHAAGMQAEEAPDRAAAVEEAASSSG